MEERKKCSFIKHQDVDAISYCFECNVFLCNKCLNAHPDFLENHHKYNLDKNIKEVFTGICQEKGHNNKLDFYCGTHNKLCCAACLSKIKSEEYGQHNGCTVSPIKNIQEQKLNKLKENMKYLEDISNKIENSVNELKKLFETINDSKEELKKNISTIFTKIRNEVNEREDKLLIEVDKKYEDLFFTQDLIKQGEKLPLKIKQCLEKGKLINQDCDKNNITLSAKINDCINIENIIKNINAINNNIEKKNLDNKKISFFLENNELNELFGKIKELGELIIEENNIQLNDKIMNDEDENDNKKYSYECVNLKKINEIYEDQKDLKIKITLKNNKKIIWPKGETKLVFDMASELQGNDINLKPQRYKEQKTYDIIVNDLDEYPPGKYTCSLVFKVDGIQYGNIIYFTVIIKERNEDFDKIYKFRKVFNLSPEDFPDEIVLNTLKKYKSEEEAYISLINIK